MENPIFSLNSLREGEMLEDLRQCTTELGFFYLTDIGVSERSHKEAVDMAMHTFMHSSDTEKEKLETHTRSIRRGYSDLEAESTASITNTGKYTDYSMCYSMGLTQNLFPSLQFENVWANYFNSLYSVATETAEAIFKAVEAPFNRSVETLRNSDPVLRVRYFPDVPEHRVAEIEPLRMAPHYDLSILTLIHQSPCSNGFVSLQAEVSGRIIDLPIIPSSILVMCGAVSTLATEGLVKAPKHHVAAPPACMREGSGRTSSVFFLRPSSTFTFSVSKAHKFGLDVSLGNEISTFGDWVGTNYVAMHKSESNMNIDTDDEKYLHQNQES